MIAETILAAGLILDELFEVWILALFAAATLLDAYLGTRDERMFLFALLQAFGLVAGYFWATADTSDPAASFPKWAYVTGVWFVGFVIVHLWYILKPKPSQ